MPFPLLKVSRDLINLLFVLRETPLQMEMSLINISVSYKGVNFTWFSELLLCLQERHILKIAKTTLPGIVSIVR